MTEKNLRVRTNAEQSSKNVWKFSVTVENRLGEFVSSVEDPNDVGKDYRRHVAFVCLDTVKQLEEAFRSDGRKVVSDKK